jgi:hypothetical protein
MCILLDAMTIDGRRRRVSRCCHTMTRLNHYWGRAMAFLMTILATTAARADATQLASESTSAQGASCLPHEERWAAGLRAHLMVGHGVRSGVGGGLTLTITRTIFEHVRVGGMLSYTPSVENPEYCSLDRSCFYSYSALGPAIELRALPHFFVDPWMRASAGVAVVGLSYPKPRGESQLDVVAEAGAGVDLRVWHLTVGPYLGLAVFGGPTVPSTVFGAQVGAEW